MSSSTLETDRIFERDNIELPEGAGRVLSATLMGLGVVLIGVTFFLALRGNVHDAVVAVHSYQAAFVLVTGLSVGAMGFVMILQQMNAGWTATIRRQFENVMSPPLILLALLLFLAGTAFQWMLASRQGVYLFEWMNTSAVQGDVLYEHKAGYLDVKFFYIRALIYFMVWLAFSFGLWTYSTRQDVDGDRWLTASARKLSAPGLIFFAFTTAFAGFDWVMTLDYHWFSTMFGVYFFAGNMVGCIALVTLTLIILRGFGRLHGAFTDEHLHDLSKVLFAFVVFWAYIGFSQYFLIWYANIPEETAWMLRRKTGAWEWLSWVLPIGHFILPFLFLLHRPIRRSRAAIAFACVWLLAMHILDLFWAVRPEARLGAEAVGPDWLDIPAMAGPILLFLGVFIRKVGSGPLMPLRDPRLPEALHHKNYV